MIFIGIKYDFCQVMPCFEQLIPAGDWSGKTQNAA
jgi:hypothetical protein